MTNHTEHKYSAEALLQACEENFRRDPLNRILKRARELTAAQSAAAPSSKEQGNDAVRTLVVKWRKGETSSDKFYADELEASLAQSAGGHETEGEGR